MKIVTILALAAALLAADAAGATSRHAGYHRPSSHIRGMTMRSRRPRVGSSHRGRRMHLATAHVRMPSGGAPIEVANRTDSDTGHDGWFQSETDKSAGWGLNQDGTQTVLGVYQRPAQPDIPGPQIYHTPEGRGAAGLSLSLKLGQ